MAEPVKLLQLSPTMTEGTIVKWLVKEGDEVQASQPIAEVETDKAVMEQESFEDGKVLKIVANEGDTVPVESLIAVIGEDGEDISAVLEEESGQKEKKEPKKEAPPQEEPDEEKEAVRGAKESPAPSAPASAPAPKEEKPAKAEGRIFASPLARKMAEDQGIDLAQVKGSGPQGRIVKADIEKAAKEGGAAKPAAAASTPAAAKPAPPSAEATEEEVPLSGIRKTIARRLVESKQTIPEFQLTVDVRGEKLLEAVDRIREANPDEKVTVTHFLIKAMANVQMRHPAIRSRWHEDKITVTNAAHIAVAVAIDEGLVTPVLWNTHTKGVLQISREVSQLAKLARDRKLQMEDMTGGTQTLSNLGMFGIKEFNAIINPPETTILAVGKMEDRPVVENGTVVPGKVMTLTLTCDHRIVDGAVGAQFLQDLKKALEDPLMILL